MSEDVKGDVPTTTTEPVKGAEVAQTLLKPEDAEKIAQSAADKVRTEYTQRLKAKEAEIEKLKESTMSAAEIRKMQEEKLAAREKELRQKELVIVATDSLRDSNLPIDFRDLVIGADEDRTKANVLILAKTFQKAVEAAVQDKFKSAGHDPKKGDPPKAAFTRAQIEAMSPEEVRKNLPAIQAQMAQGPIK